MSKYMDLLRQVAAMTPEEATEGIRDIAKTEGLPIDAAMDLAMIYSVSTAVVTWKAHRAAMEANRAVVRSEQHLPPDVEITDTKEAKDILGKFIHPGSNEVN